MATCMICKKEIKKRMWDIDVCSDKCFRKNFWNSVLDSSAIIVDGHCYHDGGKGRTHNGFKGFDGATYKIKNLKTGNVIETDNLWYNGEVPKEMRVSHPDTHMFIKGGK